MKKGAVFFSLILLIICSVAIGCKEATVDKVPQNKVVEKKSQSVDEYLQEKYKEKVFGNVSVGKEVIKMKEFVKHGIVLEAGEKGSWDDEGVAIPSILPINNRLLLWYQSRGHEQIGVALSDDGFNWKKYGKNPVLKPGDGGAWDDGSVAAPMVIKEGKNFKMWYDGNRGYKDAVALETHQIGLAYSSDGIQWKKEKKPVLGLGDKGSDSDLVVGASYVMKDNGLYYMYFDQRGTGFKDGNQYQIGLALSPDGIKWKKLMKPVFSVGQENSFDDFYVDDAHIVKKNGYYVMFYEGADGPSAQRKKYLGYAFSLDGFNWVRPDNNLLIGPEVGSFDSVNAASCWVIPIGDDYVMYYSGSNGDSGDWKIAVASTIKDKAVLIEKLKAFALDRTADEK